MTEQEKGGIPILHRLLIAALICIAAFGLMENVARFCEVEVRDAFSLNRQFAGDGKHGDFLVSHKKFIRDPELFWRIKPHFGPLSYNHISATMYTETTNSRGFRGSEEYGSKPDGIYRIVCLGDSWTYGVMVNDHETYPAQLCRLLNAASPRRRFEVLNLGCVGYSSYQGKVLFRRCVRELAPDLIMVCFGGNDARRTRIFSDRRQPRVGGWTIAVQSLLRRSRFYQALRNRILHLKKNVVTPRKGAAADGEWPQRVSPDEYEENLREIIAAAGRRGCSVILLSYLGGGPYPDAISRIGAETGVPVVDVHAILNRDAEYTVEELSINYPRDTHPNARGYSLIARALPPLVLKAASGDPPESPPAAPAPPPENNRRR